jgi:pimeloyl-ACP methyl ester carboxylesterase
MPTLSFKGHSLHYYDRGQGDALLLFHAFPLNADMWKPQLDGLSDRFRVLTPNARGFGKSRPTPDVLTMDTIAEDGRALLNSLEIEKAVIGGVSMGGYAAFAFWRKHPTRVRALVLADTRPTADSEEGREGRHAFAKNTLDKGGEWVADQMTRKLQRLEPDATVEATLREMMIGANPKAIAAAQRGMAVRQDQTEILKDIDVPVLVMVGRQDSLVPVVRAKKMADACKDARLVEIPEAGHVANLEQPAAFNEAVAKLMGEL